MSTNFNMKPTGQGNVGTNPFFNNSNSNQGGFKTSQTSIGNLSPKKVTGMPVDQTTNQTSFGNN